MTEPLPCRVSEVARLIGVGRSKVFELIKADDLPARKLGGATVILRSDLIAFFDSTPRTRHRE